MTNSTAIWCNHSYFFYCVAVLEIPIFVICLLQIYIDLYSTKDSGFDFKLIHLHWMSILVRLSVASSHSLIRSPGRRVAPAPPSPHQIILSTGRTSFQPGFCRAGLRIRILSWEKKGRIRIRIINNVESGSDLVRLWKDFESGYLVGILCCLQYWYGFGLNIQIKNPSKIALSF